MKRTCETCRWIDLCIWSGDIVDGIRVKCGAWRPRRRGLAVALFTVPLLLLALLAIVIKCNMAQAEFDGAKKPEPTPYAYSEKEIMDNVDGPHYVEYTVGYSNGTAETTRVKMDIAEDGNGIVENAWWKNLWSAISKGE